MFKINKSKLKNEYIDTTKDTYSKNSDEYGINLENAYLKEADLRHANLAGANLVDAELDASKWYMDDITKIVPLLKHAKFKYIIIIMDDPMKKMFRQQLFNFEK